MRQSTKGLLLALALLATPTQAEVPAQQAARLASDLTPMGAERAGNVAGSIPAWTGGITEPPASYEEGDWHPNPFEADEVRFTIDAENRAEHAARLTAGHEALLRTYPETWRMQVHATRRSASYPDWVYEAVVANATRAQVSLEGKGGVRNAKVGPPFPIPGTGIEVVWNHNLRWRGLRVRKATAFAAVTRLGNFRPILQLQDLGFPYGSPIESPFKRKYPNLQFAIMGKTIEPQLLAGNGILVLEPIDQTDSPRKVWTYSQSLRRVVRSPFFAYDFPAPNSESLRTTDDAFLYNGPPDRFRWKLVGKREVYVPYNAYRIHSGKLSRRDLLRVGHLAPELLRYELHRVWVVEGTLIEGQEHVYSRRVFYVDEDSWNILVAESYDLEGNLWRVNESHTVNHYEVPVLESTLDVFHDLQQRRYLAVGLANSQAPPSYTEKADPREFSPNALLYQVR